MSSQIAVILFLCGIFMFLTQTGQSQVVHPVPQKKLIHFGQEANSPYLEDIRDNMNRYETGLFDGVTLRIPAEAGGGNIFMVDEWQSVKKASREKQRDIAGEIPASPELTDNLLVLFGASQMDWFSDEDWDLVDQQIRYGARIAGAAGCVGILWDPEPYKPGKNPWRYQALDGYPEVSYQEYYKQIRKRGAQFMQALQEEFPGLVILSLRELSDYQEAEWPWALGVFPVKDPAEAISKLENAWWGLHVAFTIGILDAIEPNVQFIDGNEQAYCYTSESEYYRVRDQLMNDGRALVPPELRPKYASHYQLGHAISFDYIMGNWAYALGDYFPFRLKGQGLMLSPEQRAQWFEHNIYYTLRTSDSYAWMWTEREGNWWTGEGIPEGFYEAFRRARQKAANLEPLGFAVEDMLRMAQEKAEKYAKENL